MLHADHLSDQEDLILHFLKASPFRELFERKGRFHDYMAAIPTHVILHKHAALLGAARVAFASEG